MQRQVTLALGALATCALIATAVVLARGRILDFTQWPHANEPKGPGQIAIPQVAPPPRGVTVVGRRAPAQADRALLGGGALGGPAAIAGVGAVQALPGGAVVLPGRSPEADTISGVAPLGSNRPTTPASGPLTGTPPPPAATPSVPVAPAVPEPGAGTPVPAIPQTPVVAVLRVAPTEANLAPPADDGPVSSATDNAPTPVDPTVPTPTTPATPATEPAPAPSAPEPPQAQPVPANPNPAPADPGPPAETPAPAPAPSTPAPAPPPPAEVPAAPANPAPPADPTPAPPAASEPAPSTAPAQAAPPAAGQSQAG